MESLIIMLVLIFGMVLSWVPRVKVEIRKRLLEELDSLKSIGVDNLRVVSWI